MVNKKTSEGLNQFHLRKPSAIILLVCNITTDLRKAAVSVISLREGVMRTNLPVAISMIC